MFSWFRVEARNIGIKTKEELAVVQYTVCREPLDEIDKVLECVLRCSTSDEVDYSKLKEEKIEVPKVGEWLGIEPHSSMAGRASVVREDYPIKLFVYPRNWAQQMFYDDIFAPDIEETL